MTGGARLAWICGGLVVILAAVVLGSLLVGAAPVASGAVFDLITGRGPGQGTERTVVLGIRLPRIAAAVLAGGALAVAGAGFQALTRNPLAEPSILGVSGGAAFGVVLGSVGAQAGIGGAGAHRAAFGAPRRGRGRT
jgi:iron complex transport system permease protein